VVGAAVRASVSEQHQLQLQQQHQSSLRKKDVMLVKEVNNL